MQRLKDISMPGANYRMLFLTLLAMGLARGLHKGVLDNYFANIAAMSAFDRGVAEFFRELPGLGLILILALLYTLSAQSIFKIGGIIVLFGLALHAVVPPTQAMLTAAVCFYSLGEHMQVGTVNAISLNYARPGCGGSALGIQNALTQAGTLLGFLAIIVVFLFAPSTITTFRWVFWAAAAVAAVALVTALRLNVVGETNFQHNRFYFRRKYNKYYLLEILYGSRKQVFFTFGPYVLILFYGANSSLISFLFAVSAVCSFFAAPMVGRITDRVGYKTVMVADTLILVIVCFFYGYAHHIFSPKVAFIVCCANYVFDAMLSLASMAANLYVQDMAENAEEVKSTLATGLALNHLIAIFIALFGGWVWETLGIEVLFVISATLGVLNSAVAATIKVPEKSSAK